MILQKSPRTTIAFQRDNDLKIYDNNQNERVVSIDENSENKPLFIVDGKELEEGTDNICYSFR